MLNSITMPRSGNNRVALLGDLVIFSLATGSSYLAQSFDRPVSAALAYLVGVILVGARSGLSHGLIAAIVASIIYNFFLSEPRFRFSAHSAEQYIPLIAFNVSALLTGALAGRLKDSAQQARAAEAKNAYLLKLSDRLQQAIALPDVARIAREALPFSQVTGLEIFVLREGAYHSVDSAQSLNHDTVVDANSAEAAMGLSFKLFGAAGERGVVNFTLGMAEDDAELPDLQGIANILGLAVDRCLLLDQLSESQALQKTEELRNAILSSVSHDLRTPLTAIEAAASSLISYKSRLSGEQQEEMLTTIREQCEKLNRYTANLLDMGRIQSGIPDYMLVDIDAVEILGVVLATVRQCFPTHDIEKRIEVDTAIVRANPAMLEQLVFNLVENALVHGTGPHPVEIALRHEGEHCVLEIVDFGPGISKDEQQSVFGRFYRSKTATQRQGHGLGLHIANGFAQAFGGHISIISPHYEGHGTRMIVRLPLSASVSERIEAWQ